MSSARVLEQRNAAERLYEQFYVHNLTRYLSKNVIQQKKNLPPVQKNTCADSFLSLHFSLVTFLPKTEACVALKYPMHEDTSMTEMKMFVIIKDLESVFLFMQASRCRTSALSQ